MRLQKYLAACGVASRREAERLIEAGRVYVNGVQAHLGQVVDPEIEAVTVNETHVGSESLVYILLNKPRNVVTTAKDTHGRKTVVDLLEGVRERVFPVGRLDMDVEGALLLTNDGELAFRLTHPRYEVTKLYHVWVTGQVSPDALHQLRHGVELEDGMTAPAEVAIIDRRPDATHLSLVLHEGRKREVKRMCAAAGYAVRSLRRISFAGIRATGLRVGEWRRLTACEVRDLRRLTGLEPAAPDAAKPRN